MGRADRKGNEGEPRDRDTGVRGDKREGEPWDSGTGGNGGDKWEAMTTVKTVYTGASGTGKCGCVHFSREMRRQVT